MKKLKELLQGKKTYILAGLGIAALWLDNLFGIGLSDACKSANEAVCNLSTSDAIKGTWALIMTMTLRAGVAK